VEVPRSPTFVIVEGAVLAIAGAALWMIPDTSSKLVLQIIGLLLFASAVLGAVHERPIPSLTMIRWTPRAGEVPATRLATPDGAA
jgi:hypothetical protein